MSFIKNIAVFKNWLVFYAGRYRLLRNEYELIHRKGIRIRVRPHTDDLKIVKSNFVTMHYIRDFVPITKDSVVVDVGAHIGSFSPIAARSADRVLAYEPEPMNYQMLKKNVELNHLKNLTIVNDINKLTFTMRHCERSEAISRDCHVASLLAMTTFQGRSLYFRNGGFWFEWVSRYLCLC